MEMKRINRSGLKTDNRYYVVYAVYAVGLKS